MTTNAPYYTLYIAADSIDAEGLRTLKIAKQGGRVSSELKESTGCTTLAFSRKADRDEAKVWALTRCAELGMNPTGII